jgi:prophage regulatory protein
MAQDHHYDQPKHEMDRFLPQPEVLRITGLSAATLGREIKAKRFPAPIAISPGRRAFLASEVRAWVNTAVKAARS